MEKRLMRDCSPVEVLSIRGREIVYFSLLYLDAAERPRVATLMRFPTGSSYLAYRECGSLRELRSLTRCVADEIARFYESPIRVEPSSEPWVHALGAWLEARRVEKEAGGLLLH